jgi:hypothetical protein
MKKIHLDNELRTAFQVIPNALIFDNRLSDRARFIYVYMAAKPSGWEFYLRNMAEELHFGTETVRKYRGELVYYRWIEKKGQHNADGKFGAVTYVIKSRPSNENTVMEKNRDGKNIAQIQYITKDNIEDINKKRNLISKDISKKSGKSEKEQRFEEGMKKNYPRVMSMQNPLTYDQYNKLLEKGYTNEKIKSTLEDMENWAKLPTKSYACRTLSKWLSKN